ncbi:MAG: hypothetical protein KAJ78_00490 [Acidobacteria bacterium]|nr:hypothetical protein [Acidobacteriota bacterium]
MRKLVVFLVLFVVVAVIPVGAQVSDQTILTYEVLTEDFDALVKEAMALTDEQWKAFEPVFDDYKAVMHPVFEKRINLIKEFVKKQGVLTDAEARAALAGILEIEQDEWLVQRDFQKEFLEVIPAVKALRFWQIENRMMLMLLSSVAKDVPLAK